MGHIQRTELSGFSMKGQLQLHYLPEELTENQPYLVNGTRGNNYTLAVSKSSISIAANTIKGVRLLAEIKPENNYLEWRLYTRPLAADKPTHDLYAGLFYDAAMKYFLSQNQEISAIYSNWNGGTNHSQYRQAIRNKKTIQQAALETWNGRKASEHGFDQVKPLSPTGLDVMSYIFLFLRG